MTISSRTPEGLPFRCPVCGAASNIEPSIPPGDAPCPRCGHLLWWFRERLGDVTLDTSIHDLEIDSLEAVELVMAAESELGISIADEDYGGFQSIADIVHYLAMKQSDGSK